MKSIVCLFLVALVGIAASEFVHVSYSVMSANSFRSVNMTVAHGMTVFDLVALQDSLDKENWGVEVLHIEDYGRVITSIAGLANDEDEKVAWYLYVLPTYPSGHEIPDDEFIAKTAVDHTPTVENQHYLYVYREVKSANMN